MHIVKKSIEGSERQGRIEHSYIEGVSGKGTLTKKQ